MSKEEIKIELSKCRNLVELIGKASELKRNGEKETVVNRVVTDLRKSLLNANSSIKKIERINVTPIPMDAIGQIPFQINDLGSPTILYDGTSILI